MPAPTGPMSAGPSASGACEDRCTGVRIASRPLLGALLLATMLSLTAACGGEQTPAGGAPPTTGAAASAGTARNVAAGALREFECDANATGSWSATGTLVNTSGRPADFVVTVVVAGTEDITAGAKRQRVRGLAAGESAPLELRRLPAPAGVADLGCQVQVLRR